MNIRLRPLRLVFLLWAGLLGLTLAGSAAADSSRLVSVQPAIHSAELEVLIRLEGAFQYTFFELQDPLRLVMDFTPVQEVAASGVIPVQAFGVEKIRTGQPQPGTARVVFEFGARTPFYLINKTPDGVQVLFLSGAGEKRIKSPKPPAGQPQLPAPEQPQSAVSEPEKKAATPPTTLIGLDLVNMTLADQRFQDVFGHRTKSCLAFDLSQVLFASGRLALAFGAEYQRLSLEGRSTITGQATQVSMAPLNLGLRFIFRAGSFWPYASAGLAVYHYEEKSSLHNTRGYSTGFSLQGGVYFGTSSFRLLRAKAFLRWTRVVSEKNGLRVNLGGMEIGAGLALAFNLF
ncbi:MAG TPA: AMIN domain-containing protein [Acidobacteriota bacterium]